MSRQADRQLSHFTSVTEPREPPSARTNSRATLSTDQLNHKIELTDFNEFILTVSVDFREFSVLVSVSRPLADPPCALHWPHTLVTAFWHSQPIAGQGCQTDSRVSQSRSGWIVSASDAACPTGALLIDTRRVQSVSLTPYTGQWRANENEYNTNLTFTPLTVYFF